MLSNFVIAFLPRSKSLLISWLQLPFIMIWESKKITSVTGSTFFPITHILIIHTYISSVQLLSHVQLFATPWTAAYQAALSITNSWSLLKLRYIGLVMPSSVIPFSSCLQSFPASGSFQMSQFLTSGGQSIGISASASVLPMNIQDWFLLGWTGWVSLQSKGLSRVFSNTTVQKHQFFGA